MNALLENIDEIKKRMELACRKAGRNPEDVKLLLATKTVAAERIKIALENGSTLIAENKVQELKEKYKALKDTPHTKHFIGHLQTNKIKDVIKHGVTCLQSLDRWDLAQKLHDRLEKEHKTMNVFIQVNTSNEESKFGVHPKEALAFIKQVATLDRIQIKGLMTIGLFSAEKEKVRKCFQTLKNIQQEIIELRLPNVEVQELSMGMSSDLEIAIEEGATIVRIGTAVFGERIYSDSYYWNENKV